MGSVVGLEPTKPIRAVMRSATAARACATASVPCALHHLPGDAFGGRPDVGLVAPTIVEHPLVAPLVAVLLEQRRDESERRILGRERRLAGLEALDDRRRILDALALGRHHQRHQGQLGVFLELGLDRRRARDPVVRQVLETKVRTNLHRVRRELGAEDPVGHIQRLRFSQKNRPPTTSATITQKNA